MKAMLFDTIRNNHSLMMILCCALPIIAVLSLSFLGILGSWGYYALFLICPLSHILMLGKGHAEQVKGAENKSCH